MTVPANDLTKENSVLDIIGIDNGATSIAVPSTTTVYSKHFQLQRNVDFGLLIKLLSSGSYDVKVELQVGNTTPTDKAADVDGLWAVAQTISSGLTAAGPFILLVSPIVAQFGRLKFTGQGANHASTVVNVCQLNTSKRH